jgi:hypothetical protein
MGRVIKYWIALGGLAGLVTYGTALLVFRRIDLSFVTFAAVLCAPLLQSLVLVWRAEAGARVAATVAWSLLRHPLAQPVLVLDGLAFAAGLVAWETHLVGFGAPVNVHATWTLVKTAAAAAFLAGGIARASGGGARLAMLWHVAPAVLLTLALEPSASWMAASFARVLAMVGPQLEVVQRLIFYGTLYWLLIALVLRSARRLDAVSHEAAAMFHALVAAALVTGLAVTLACFNLPVVTQPWLGVASMAASAAATSLLLAAICLATAPRLRSGQAGRPRPQGAP